MKNGEFSPEINERDDVRMAFMQAWNTLSGELGSKRLTLDDENFREGTEEKPCIEHGSKAFEFRVKISDLDAGFLRDNDQFTDVAFAFWTEHGGQKGGFFPDLSSVPMFTMSYSPFIKGDYIESVQEDGSTFHRAAVFVHVMPDEELLSQAHLMQYGAQGECLDDGSTSIEHFTPPSEPTPTEEVSLRAILKQVELKEFHPFNGGPFSDGPTEHFWPGGELKFWIKEADLEELLGKDITQ